MLVRLNDARAVAQSALLHNAFALALLVTPCGSGLQVRHTAALRHFRSTASGSKRPTSMQMMAGRASCMPVRALICTSQIVTIKRHVLRMIDVRTGLLAPCRQAA